MGSRSPTVAFETGLGDDMEDAWGAVSNIRPLDYDSIRDSYGIR